MRYSLIKVFCTFFLMAVLLFGASFKQKIAEPNRYYHSCPFSFTLKQNAKTSAGVFDAEGVLIKTLWSGISYPAGTHDALWDGTNDEGNLAPAARYQIRVLSNNVNYTWEGVIGNTSEKFTGPTLFRAHNPIQGIAIAGNTAYYTVGYNEQGSSGFKFDTQKHFSKSNIAGGGIEANSVATDGKNVYWTAFEIKTNTNFIHVTSVANDAPVNLSGGQLMQVVKTKVKLNVLEKASLPDKIKGLAVQKNGEYLLVAHYNTNQVHVLNKTTGQLRSKLSLTSPDAIAVDGSNHAWISYIDNGKPAVSLFSITESGNLQSSNESLPGLVKPLAIAVSPDNALVVVADGGNSQQLKAFDNKTGTVKWIFGEAGGYARNADVRNDKFYFSDLRSQLGTCLAFEPDGSFWVEDSGNSRLQHYSANHTFINRVMFLPTSYNTTVNRTDQSSVFSDYLEFKIDYTKPLQPGNNSWTLVKNWGALVPSDLDRKYTRLKDVITLSNGRTYALIGGKVKQNRQVVEFTAQGSVRFTGYEIPMNYSMDKNGDLYRVSNFELGLPNVWFKRKLKINEAGNLTWGPEIEVASTAPTTANDPLNEGNGVVPYASEITSSQVFVGFNPRVSTSSTRPHLGGVKLGDHKWLWQTAIGTHKGYKGDFPTNGAFDNGNGVRYAGSLALALDRSIFWGYYGEFWKNSETNKWNQVYDDGLFVGQFGITGPQVSEKEGAAMMAGNAMAASVVKDNNGNAYLYHNDEGTHSGVHRWKINNLQSISEQTIAVNLAYHKQGLLAEYFRGDDLNNLNKIYSGISPTVERVKVGNRPVSARFTGFIKPANSSSYTFEGTTTNGMRLWLNNKLIINNWEGKSGKEKSSPIALNSSTAYAIKIEYRQLSFNNSNLLRWSEASGATVSIPNTQLWPAESSEQSSAKDLLAGLPYDASLQDGLYGWKRDKPNEDLTNKYSKWWTVHTNVRKYDRFSSPDLYISFRQANSVNTVTRSLGDNTTSLKQWKLNAIVNFEGNYANEDADLSANGNGGSYIEVLDDGGRVITRLFFHSDNGTDVGQLFANNKSVFKTTRDGLRNVMYLSHPLIIEMENGIATVKFGSYPAIKTSAFDPASHWSRPQTLRFYFWCKTKNSSRAIDIEKLYYSVIK